jgi:hypothetical protein
MRCQRKCTVPPKQPLAPHVTCGSALNQTKKNHRCRGPPWPPLSAANNRQHLCHGFAPAGVGLALPAGRGSVRTSVPSLRISHLAGAAWLHSCALTGRAVPPQNGSRVGLRPWHAWLLDSAPTLLTHGDWDFLIGNIGLWRFAHRPVAPGMSLRFVFLLLDHRLRTHPRRIS